KHLEDAAFLQHVSLEGYNQPLYCQDFKQQHQHQLQQQHWRRAEGVGSAELAFGGLTFDECTAVFFAPNVRCHHLAFPPVPPNLSPFASPPPASQAPHFASQAATFSAATANASTSEFSLAHDAFPIAAASTAAAVRRPLKRPRDDCTSLGADQLLLGGRESRWMRGGAVRGGVVCGGMVYRGMVCCTQRWRQSVAEQFQQQGESSRVQQQAADEALLEALLWEERGQQQQGGVRSRAQRVLWPRIGSKSALPDDVLLGCSSDEPALMQRATLSAPPPTRPHAELPAPTPSQFATPPASTFCVGNSALCCGDFAPCIGDFGEGWPRVGSESALPDDVLLGVCCEDRAFTQCSAPSAAPPTQPRAALPAPMPSLLAAPPSSALESMSSGMTRTLDGSAGAMQELEYLDARIAMLGNGNSSNHNHSNDKENDNGNCALFLDTPVAHMLLDGRTLTVHLGSEPQQQALAAPGAAGADQPEWAVEQGGTWEGDAQRHQHRQLKGCGCGELERILSHHQPLLPLSQIPMLRKRQAQSVAKQFQQQGESRRVQDEEAVLLDALLLEEHRQLHGGGGRRRVQSALWPYMEWESALPDDVLRGFSSLDAGVTTPHAPVPEPLPTPLAAALAGSGHCRWQSVFADATNPYNSSHHIAYPNLPRKLGSHTPRSSSHMPVKFPQRDRGKGKAKVDDDEPWEEPPYVKRHGASSSSARDAHTDSSDGGGDIDVSDDDLEEIVSSSGSEDDSDNSIAKDSSDEEETDADPAASEAGPSTRKRKRDAKSKCLWSDEELTALAAAKWYTRDDLNTAMQHAWKRIEAEYRDTLRHNGTSGNKPKRKKPWFEYVYLIKKLPANVKPHVLDGGGAGETHADPGAPIRDDADIGEGGMVTPRTNLRDRQVLRAGGLEGTPSPLRPKRPRVNETATMAAAKVIADTITTCNGQALRQLSDTVQLLVTAIHMAATL
ncbi:unnamed protein product, partial [Closterium sp. NIES-53]